MSLTIFFHEDVADRLLALYQANERALALAERYGMDTEAAELYQDVYAGALGDVAASFGLVLPDSISYSDQSIPLTLARDEKDRWIATRKCKENQSR